MKAEASSGVSTHFTNLCVVSCFLEAEGPFPLSTTEAAGLARASVTSAITTSFCLDPDPESPLVTDSLVRGPRFSGTASLDTDSRGVVDGLDSGRRP